MWKTYRDNAVENLDSARLLLKEQLFTTSYECSFFAVEIILKAWIVKYDDPEKKYGRTQRKPCLLSILRQFKILGARIHGSMLGGTKGKRDIEIKLATP